MKIQLRSSKFNGLVCSIIISANCTISAQPSYVEVGALPIPTASERGEVFDSSTKTWFSFPYYNSGDLNLVYSSQPGTNDSFTWTQTTSFPSRTTYWGRGASDGANLYFTGNIDAVSKYASTTTNGFLGTWQPLPALPNPAGPRGRSLHQTFIYSGRLYVIGGWHGDGLPAYSDAYYAPIQGGGSLGSFVQTTSLPVGVVGHSATVSPEGMVYVVNDTNLFTAQIAVDGTIGGWTTELPIPGLHHNNLGNTAVALAGNLLIVVDYTNTFVCRLDVFGHFVSVANTITNPAYFYERSAYANNGKVYVTATSGRVYRIDNLPPVPPPTITSQPQSLNTTLGSSATFTVTAFSTDRLVYQWFKDGIPLPSATNTDLTFTNVQPPSAGNYTVLITNVGGSVTSSVASIAVVQGPNSRRMAVGSKVVFATTAYGSGPFWYQWSHNSLSIVNGTNRSLILTNIQMVDAGNYSLAVSNANGVSTVSATLDVTLGIQPLSQTNLVVVRVGDGVQNLSTFGNSAFVDQYDTHGNYQNTINVPDSGPEAVVMSGSSFVEGYLSRSLDNRQLCFPAYGTNAGAGVDVTTSTNVPRAVLTVDAAGVVNRALQTTADYSGVNFRSAATDGTNNFWGAGSAGGTIYLGNTQPRGVVQNAKLNNRVVQLFNGRLYVASAAVSQADGLAGIYEFLGLPKTNVGLPIPIVLTNTFNTNSFTGINDFAISPTGSTIYFADDRPLTALEGGIQRWDRDSSSGIWSNTYHIANEVVAAGVSHLAVDWSGPQASIFATTKESSQNRLISGLDTGPNSTFTNLAQATPKQVFRGVKFGPAGAIPEIISQPTNAVIIAGEPVGFTVVARGTSPLSYQWLNAVGPITNATNASFVIASAQTNDTGGYHVIVSNPYAVTTSSVAQLFVYIPAAITSQPQTQLLPASANAYFSATAIGYPALSYQWLKDGTNLLGSISSSLAITNVGLENLGVYSLAAWNAYSATTSSLAWLLMSPSIATPFTGTVALWGHDAVLSVSAVGSGNLSYQWFWNGAALNGATNDTLTIPTVQFTNQGLYSVVVSSPWGSITNEPSQLVVNPANIGLGLYAGITIEGVPGYTYEIQYNTNLANTNSWLTITNLTLTQPVELWIDTSTVVPAPGVPKRFYRVLGN